MENKSRGRPRVVVTNWIHAEVESFLKSFCEPILNRDKEPYSREKLLHLCQEADGLMVFMNDHVDEMFLESCPRLRIISAALKGYDNFDIQACDRRRICFAYVPDRLTVPTAELALGMMIGLGRRLAAGDQLIRSGTFKGWRPILYGEGLAGRTLGIMGMGRVGRALARRASACDMTILYNDHNRLDEDEEGLMGASFCSFHELLAGADYLVPLLPLNPQTHHIINHATIERMRPGALLINCGRGSVADENAVADALRRGRLGGYAADVFEMEDWALNDRPREIPSELLAMQDKTFFSPHLGSAVDQIRLDIAMEAATHLKQFFDGSTPEHAVNEGPHSDTLIESE